MFNQQSQEKGPLNSSKNEDNLNNYILQDKIGSGSFEKVYRVKKKNTDEIYVAKIYNNELDKKVQQIFLNISHDGNILPKLKHPSILKYILYSQIDFKQKCKPVIITEYASNGTLAQLIKHNQRNSILNDTLKLIIIYGIASAMAYLHSLQIIHYNLKPENVLFDDFLFPKIADFGFSKSDNISQERAENPSIFTPPEVLSQGEYTKLSDVYSFSSIVYQIVSFEKPFLENAISHDHFEFEAIVPTQYKGLITRCWSHDPSSRPTFDQILTELKTDRKYITETINEGEYLNYIKYIDEYKATFDSSKLDVSTNCFTKYCKSFNGGVTLFKVIENFTNFCNHFPYKYFKLLCEENQKIVEEAEAGDNAKQFEVGKNLIEGRHGFPTDVKIGLDFLKESSKKGNKDALIYYINMLIKGELIPANHMKARNLIDKNFSDDKPAYFFYQGKLCKKEKRYLESAEFFRKSMELGNSESLYEYAELLRKNRYRPENQEDIDKYYIELIKNGHLKAMFKYGIILCNSDEKEKQEEGILLIKNAADKGCLKAQSHCVKLNEINKT